MRILVVGAGGREHAVTWALSQSASGCELFCSPGSDAISRVASSVPIQPENCSELASFAEKNGVELTVIGPEAPLAAGLSDELRRRGLAVLGPSREAAQLESSKIFAKQFLFRHGIPTAEFDAFDRLPVALAFAESSAAQYPLVIKADGLAGGKGVEICHDAGSAREFLLKVMETRQFGAAGNRVAIEEYLVGEELSYMVVCDGRRHLPLALSRDHKRLLDNDQGPNTGGMGAYSSDRIIPEETRRLIEHQIVIPSLTGMAAEGRPFQGILYIGLMLTREGPKVLEYNVRLGDPETQAILMRYDGDLALALKATADGNLSERHFRWRPGVSLCVVLTAEGYPERPRYGATIHGLEEASGLPESRVFHAGTRFTDGQWQTAGGRVLGVTATGDSLSEARDRAYEAVGRIHFDGMHYRKDIGLMKTED